MPRIRGSAICDYLSRTCVTDSGGCRISSARRATNGPGTISLREACTWIWLPRRRKFFPSQRKSGTKTGPIMEQEAWREARDEHCRRNREEKPVRENKHAGGFLAGFRLAALSIFPPVASLRRRAR